MLSLTPDVTSRGKRAKSLTGVNSIFDLSTVLAHKRANNDNSDDFCTVNKPIFLDVHEVFTPKLSHINDMYQQVLQ